jgi:hypothetical protein
MENQTIVNLNKQDVNLEEKQIYIKEEILFKGYDTEEFLNGLILKKGEEADNLNLLTLDELKQEFVDYKERAKNKMIVEIDLKNKSETHQIGEEYIKLKNSIIRDYQETILCYKQEKSPLADIKKIKILISE